VAKAVSAPLIGALLLGLNGCGGDSASTAAPTILASSIHASQGNGKAADGALPAAQMEYLNRGVTAIASDGGVFISWRALGTDPADMRFNVYRDGVLLNSEPLELTNYVDAQGSTSHQYSVRPVINKAERAEQAAGAVWSTNKLTVPIQRPAGGTTPDNVAYTYEANDGSAADLDGDGVYELLVKWQPTNAKDNSQSGYTGNTYIDAYKLDGTLLWRIDFGRNIRAGAHYTHFLAYDFDGDGRAELMAKTADGTVDGKGTVIGDANADYRNRSGYVLSGPEFLTVFSGQDGSAMATVPYVPPRGSVSSWGDNYGNRVDRFLAGVAYLDGERPSAVFSRGYYTRAVIAAWDWRDGQLTQRWVFDSNVDGKAVAGQGAHSFSVADVNGDGKQDIVYGAATISSEGKFMYSTGLCHGDALHVSDFDPTRAGLEVFMVHESPSCYKAYGSEMHDAATGQILWGNSGSGSDVGRGVCIDIDPAYPGVECWASRGPLTSVQGVAITTSRPGRMNFAAWWDGDLGREIQDSNVIEKWNPATRTSTRLLTATGSLSNNGTKATPTLTADLFGDWREELVLRRADNNALEIYATTIPTAHRVPTLMHDPQYRVQVANENSGYNQPPHPSYFLGYGATVFPQAPIYTPCWSKGAEASNGNAPSLNPPPQSNGGDSACHGSTRGQGQGQGQNQGQGQGST
jgi:rhamnogalacturonan endolyase